MVDHTDLKESYIPFIMEFPDALKPEILLSRLVLIAFNSLLNAFLTKFQILLVRFRNSVPNADQSPFNNDVVIFKALIITFNAI
ncbi:hypothetical protein SDC9_165508 [bioreactor metagenome]|uniref:Uncharacterized protein n=1 Tax=bioreactor metagenome TaxID=1076179 RepID=A0A645FWW0_9ZZZZ